MATHKSAKKRARQTEKRTARNRQVRTGLKTVTKAVRTALDGGQAEVAGTALRQAESAIRRAASKGVISKKQASRRVSRLAKRTHALG